MPAGLAEAVCTMLKSATTTTQATSQTVFKEASLAAQSTALHLPQPES
jgi:hypothetical protein